MFKFNAFKEEHLVLFRSWLNQDHIKKFWQEPEDAQQLKEKFLVKLPQRGVHAFIIEFEDANIGYIQYYDAHAIGGGYWKNEEKGTFGIDLMIGEKSFLVTGLGPKVIKEFLRYLCSSESEVKSIIIDPDPKNISAIRAFEKTGFVKEAEVTTPGGPALLMRMKITEL